VAAIHGGTVTVDPLVAKAVERLAVIA